MAMDGKGGFRRCVIAVLACFCAVAVLAGYTPRPLAASEAAAWAALADGGNLVLLRHAIAPGTGDPAEFRLDDCATQRTLSKDGRRQARLIGKKLRTKGVAVEAVYSSQWCRCLETARLLDAGSVEPLPALNSFFNRPADREAQLAELRPWLAAAQPEGAIVLVTHQVVITALTGVFPGSGEMVVVKPGDGGGLSVVGRIPPPRAAPPASGK